MSFTRVIIFHKCVKLFYSFRICFDELCNTSFDGEIKDSILTIKSASKIDEYSLDKITSNDSGLTIREWNKQQKITVYAIFFKSEIHRDRILSIAQGIICFMSNMLFITPLAQAILN